MLQQIEDYLMAMASAPMEKTPNFYLENNDAGDQFFFKNIDGVAFLCNAKHGHIISMGWLHKPVWVEEAVYKDINNTLGKSE